ncbi:MAG: hypothetical protein K2P58_10435 [Hyphomonadaceae bacterium]|nr:hypothetical protein [Hyphomonadaceae bacterium]
MIYVIGQLAPWLLLAAGFAALAGWAWAKERDGPAQRALEHEREKLLRDLGRAIGGEREEDDGASERQGEAMQRLLTVRDGRIAELERLLDAARARADEAAGRVAELERAPLALQHNDELDRLRARVAEQENARAREVEVVAEPSADAEALGAWRLRYFEQRVKYLEGLPRAAESKGIAALPEWRAREAEARASHLEAELRSRSRSPSRPVQNAPAFAANADVDALLRWRTLYLERRAQYAREEAGASARALTVQAPLAAQADRWKWRTRYLEARVRHLEQARVVGPAGAPAAQPAPREQAPITRAQTSRRAKPPVLSGPRNGAPDDLTLIERVSLLQRTTLYSLGVFHFDQIAAWTAENVAWLDQYFRLDGRIEAEEWVEQAADLVRDGVAAARRIQHEDA